MNDIALVKSLDWSDQCAFFEKSWEIQDKKIKLDCYTYYDRENWCVAFCADIYFSDNASKGSFFHKILYEERDDADYQKEVRDLIIYIVNFIDNYDKEKSFIPADEPYKEFVVSFHEGIKGPTEEERIHHQKEIDEHNAAAEKFRAEHPNYAIEVMLMPGLSSIFGDKVDYKAEWDKLIP